jgi:hypothetical protein
MRLLAFLLVLTAAPLARAQAILHEEEPSLPGSHQSPQRWAIELRFGPYRPDVDSEFNGAASPHQAFFGSKHRLMFQAEGDYQFFNRFGSAAVTVSAGYFRESAKSFVEGSTTDVRSGDDTSLTLYPLGAGLAYRFDLFARRLNIPLVPYAKAGLTYTVWSIANGNGDVATGDGGGRGRGGTPGWSAGAGLAFLLNFLDPNAARTFDGENGVNRTFLFFELDHLDSSGLGRKNALHVGDDTWFAGLMFEF